MRNYIKGRGKSFLEEYTEKGLSAKRIGARVLVNSLPKAGTHLVESLLDVCPWVINNKKRTIREQEFRVVRDKLRRIRPGFFQTAHLGFRRELLEYLESQGIKVIEVVRDPRDVVVSRWKYISGVHVAHKAHRELMRIRDDEARLSACILGIPNVIKPIGEVLREHKAWLSDRYSLVVRFEDLIGPRGGGTRELQLKVIKDVLTYLGFDSDDAVVEDMAKQVFSENSITFSDPGINKWKRYFSDEQKVAFKNSAGKELIAFGYEESFDW